MEAPKYDEDLNYWQAPTREYYREEKASDDKMMAERFNEIAFFFNIAVFSILMILSCATLSAGPCPLFTDRCSAIDGPPVVNDPFRKSKCASNFCIALALLPKPFNGREPPEIAFF